MPGVVAVAVLVTVLFVMDKKQRWVQLAVVGAAALYLGATAFGFISTGYSGEGSYYAQFNPKSVTAAFLFIPSVSHQVAALNVAGKSEK